MNNISNGLCIVIQNIMKVFLPHQSARLYLISLNLTNNRIKVSIKFHVKHWVMVEEESDF